MPHEVEGSTEDNADQGEVAQVKDDNVDSIGWDRPRGDVGSLFSLKKFKTNKQNEGFVMSVIDPEDKTFYVTEHVIHALMVRNNSK